MSKNVRKWLPIAAVLLMDVVGLIFIGVSIFGNEQGTKTLGIGLLCIAVGNVINLFMIRKRKKENEAKEKQQR